MSDFSDRPLVAGSLFGLRAFDIDGLGRLRGPSFPQVFTPELNIAECRKSEMAARWAIRPALHYPLFFGGQIAQSSVEPFPEPEPTPRVTHTPGILDCKCGFYAYFDGNNDYKQASRVAAIIEGFGVCTLGDRGFRAEKARLVAIIEPGPKFPSDRERLHRNYPDIPLYERKRDALAAHPLSTGRIPSPESDPDFWTRDAS